MPARTHNASQHVLTKPIPCQGGHKMYLNMRLPNPYYASEDTKCNSTYVDQTHPMPARTRTVSQLVLKKTPPMQAKTQYISQHVLTKTLWSQWGHKMHLNMRWPNLPNASKDTNSISKWVYQNPPMTVTKQNVSKNVLTKFMPCPLGLIIYLKLCWPWLRMHEVYLNIS